MFFLALHFHSFDVISNSFWVFETSFMFNILISKNISERPEHFSIQTCGTCLCNKVAQQYNDCPDTKLCGHDFKKGTFAFLVKSWRIFFFFFLPDSCMSFWHSKMPSCGNQTAFCCRKGCQGFLWGFSFLAFRVRKVLVHDFICVSPKVYFLI